MAKATSSPLHQLARLVKNLIALLLIPIFLGLVQGLRQEMDAHLVGGRSMYDWVMAGVVGYMIIHLFLYRPTAVFQFHHRVLSVLSKWLFGGQVSTAESMDDKPSGKRKGKPRAPSEAPQESTLLVLSPYLVPFYTVMLCAFSWMVSRWIAGSTLGGVVGALIGASLSMHWIMTAADLQEHREQVPFDAYLMALVIIGLFSLLIVMVCMPMAVPDVSLPSMLSDAIERTRAIYSAIIQTLFF